MSFKIGDKVRLTTDVIHAGSYFPEGTIGEVTAYWGSDEGSVKVPYPYYVKIGPEERLYAEDELELYTEKTRFKSTGMTVPFNAHYLGTGKAVTVISVTDTSLGRIYWVQSPEGFVFSMPEVMFIKVL
jgi:hypothetical protein